MRIALVLITVLVACGDGNKPARPDASTQSDAGPTPDAPVSPDAAVDAPPDAPPSASELIADAKATADGDSLTLPIMDATVTYLKPQIGSTTNDPAGFTIQASQAGPALFISVDPTTLTPPAEVGDVVNFTITSMDTVGMQRRATAITNFSRTSTGADVNALVKDVTTATDLLTAMDDYESEIIDITGVAVGTFGSSGSGFERASITTTGMSVENSDFQVRVPATLRDAIDLTTGCTFTLNNTPVGRFNDQVQLAAFTEADITLTNCPAPTVVSAIALSATSVRVTFSRRVLASSLMTDGSQFTIDNNLTVSAASVDGRTVTLTTSTQTAGTTYTVTVANSLTDLQGTALATPLTAMFSGFVTPAGVRINELNANVTSGCDLIEVRVTSTGSLAGFSLKERNVTIFTFPSLEVQMNDFIVIHLNSGSATCNPGTATNETTKDGQPAATYVRNYDTAFDLWASDSGLTNTDNVFTLYNASNEIVDAVFVSDDPAGPTAASDTETQAAIVGMASQWSPALNAYVDTVFRTNAADDLNATGTAQTGSSIQRVDDTDDNDKADWTTGAGVTATWGELNVGQSAL